MFMLSPDSKVILYTNIINVGKYQFFIMKYLTHQNLKILGTQTHTKKCNLNTYQGKYLHNRSATF